MHRLTFDFQLFLFLFSFTKPCPVFGLEVSWQFLLFIQSHARLKILSRFANFFPRLKRLILSDVLWLAHLSFAPSILLLSWSKTVHSWFSLTWWDGHIGAQNNGQTSLKFGIIIIESKVPKKLFSLLFCTPTWPPWRHRVLFCTPTWPPWRHMKNKNSGFWLHGTWLKSTSSLLFLL